MDRSFSSGLHIYAENTRGRDRAYEISHDRISDALTSIGVPVAITVATHGEPNLAALREADVFIGSNLDTAVLSAHAHKVKIIHTINAGVERYIPLDWLPAGAVLTNSKGIHAAKTAEFGAMALLMLNDRIPFHVTGQRQHTWRRALSTPIKGKRALVYGVGTLGGAVAQSAKRLGLTVWGIRRTPVPHPDVDQMFAPHELQKLLPEIDFLVVTCPLTSQTRGAIGATEIGLLKSGAGIVNIARAAVVDYAALVAALRDGKLSGAILDVFDQEPLPPEAPWWDEPNLIVTPHVSADDPVDYVKRSLEILRDNVIRLIEKNQSFRNVVSSAREY